MDEFEKVLAEGLGIVRRGTLVHTESARRRSTLTLLDLSDEPLRSIDVRRYEYYEQYKKSPQIRGAARNVRISQLENSCRRSACHCW